MRTAIQAEIVAAPSQTRNADHHPADASSRPGTHASAAMLIRRGVHGETAPGRDAGTNRAARLGSVTARPVSNTIVATHISTERAAVMSADQQSHHRLRDPEANRRP